MKRNTWSIWAAAGGGLGFVIADQLIKVIALKNLATESYRLGSHNLGIDVALSLNAGAFLSVGHDLPTLLKTVIFYLVAAVIFGVLYWAFQRWQEHPATSAALYLIALGGGSNLIDRFWRDGRVVDYLVFNLGPLHTGVFNLADVAIMVGVTYLVASGFSSSKRATA